MSREDLFESGPSLPASAETRDSLTRRLFAVPAKTPDSFLTPLESRLVQITRELWLNGTTLARVKANPEHPPEISPEIAAEGARLAFAAAVEIEQPLREIRDSLEARRS